MFTKWSILKLPCRGQAWFTDKYCHHTQSSSFLLYCVELSDLVLVQLFPVFFVWPWLSATIPRVFFLTLTQCSYFLGFLSDLDLVQQFPMFLGGSALNAGQLADCIDRAFTRSREVTRLISETMNSVER